MCRPQLEMHELVRSPKVEVRKDFRSPDVRDDFWRYRCAITICVLKIEYVNLEVIMCPPGRYHGVMLYRLISLSLEVRGWIWGDSYNPIDSVD